jgi:hypothetical protein
MPPEVRQILPKLGVEMVLEQKHDGDESDSITDSESALCLMARKSVHTNTASHGARKMALDSGASTHFVQESRLDPASIKKGHGTVKGVGGTSQITASGNFVLDSTKSVTVKGAHAVSNLPVDLLSPGQFDSVENMPTLIQNGRAYVFRPDTKLAFNWEDVDIACTLSRADGLYYIDLTPAAALLAQTTAVGLSKLMLLHQRTAHVHWDYLNAMTGLKGEREFCKSCAQAKMHKKSIPHAPASRSKVPLWKIHSDILSKRRPTVEGYTTGTLFVDDCTGYAHVASMKRKSEFPRSLRDYVTVVTSFGEHIRVRALHADSEAIYKMAEEVKIYCSEQGILQTFSPPYRHELNGIAERTTRTLDEMAGAMGFLCNAPDMMWMRQKQAAVWVYNNMPLKSLGWRTRLEAVKKTFPGTDVLTHDQRSMNRSLSFLRVFGCSCHCLRDKSVRKKGESHTREAIFVGYSLETPQSYLVLDLTTKRVTAQFDVTFNETVFPWKKRADAPTDHETQEVTPESDDSDSEADASEADETTQGDVAKQGEYVEIVDDNELVPQHQASDDAVKQQQVSDSNQQVSFSDDITEAEQPSPEDRAPTPLGTRRTTRAHAKPAKDLAEERRLIKQAIYNADRDEKETKRADRAAVANARRAAAAEKREARANTNQSKGMPHQDKTSSTAEVSEPAHVQEPAVDASDLEPSVEQALFAMIAATRDAPLDSEDEHAQADDRDLALQLARCYVTWSDETEPKRYEQAINSSSRQKWIDSMADEIKSQKESQTWVEVPRPKNRRVHGSTWVYKIKLEGDGSFRYKSRLCLQGFTQVKGIDFKETFAPVVRMTTIRLLLALAARFDLELRHVDVVTAFLNSKIEDEVYMEQPKGFANDPANIVCKLLRAIYGTKQAGRAWNIELNDALVTFGFRRLQTDNGLYVLRRGVIWILLACWVDDMIIAHNHSKTVDSLLLHFTQRRKYKIKDLGDLKWVVGMRVLRDRKNKSITLDQSAYIGNVLKRFNMTDCNPAPTPSHSSVKLILSMAPSNDQEIKEMRDVPYRSAVGSVMYAMVCTRPDIAAAVGEVCRYMQNPGPQHWTAVKRIIRYLKGTQHLPLTLKADSEIDLLGFSDSDWASNVDNRRSTTGFIFKLFGCTISWASILQVTVALSSTEAEYMAVATAARECTWLQHLLQELELPFEITFPTVIFEDNMGAISLAKNPVGHSRNKHIEVRHHFIREKVQALHILLEYLNTKEMEADILTKTGIPKDLFLYLRDKIMRVPVSWYKSARAD